MSGLTGNNILAGSSGQGGYEIEQSLRFEDGDSAYLNRTPASASNQKTWTWSCWAKKGNNGVNFNTFCVGPNNTNDGQIYFNTSNKFVFFGRLSSSIKANFESSAVYRDVSSWYHIVVLVDTTQAVSTDRVKIYINGSQVTDFGTATYPSLNDDLPYNSNSFVHYIGKARGDAAAYIDGYLAEVNFIDGQALTPSDFGETDLLTNQWIPKKYVGTYGTNGFYLNFSDSASLGADSSGNGNNFTPTNLAATDQVLDSPTNNFATLNSLTNYPNTQGVDPQRVFSEGNTRVKHSVNAYGSVVTNVPVNSGKWYVECCVDDLYLNQCGMAVASAERVDDSQHIPFITDNGSGSGWGYDASSLFSMTTGTIVSTPNVKFSDGDIMAMTLDLDSSPRTCEFFKNNVSIVSVPDIDSDGNMSDIIFAFGRRSGPSDMQEMTVNFGQDSSFAGKKTAQNNTDANGIGDFYYALPSGYLALCTANLPDPSIALPGEHFNTVLYTGLYGTSDSYTGVGFQPDFTWIKHRNNPTAYSHQLYDAVRGATNYLISNTTAAENDGGGPFTAGLQSFDSDGFTIGQTLTINASGVNHVAWNWKANGSGVSNTDGTITSTVSANTTAGFSIVSYTGNGSSSATVGHGLGATPAMIIVKYRSGTPPFGGWFVAHKSMSTNYQMQLQATSSASASSAFSNGGLASPNSSSTFSFINGSTNVENVNDSGTDYIAYIFAEVEGYSKFGSYTGNGSADGAFVYTGFRPAFVMIKRTDSTGGWSMADSARPEYNPAVALQANTTVVEFGSDLDITSNGFKVRTTWVERNASGGTYIYMAFAESPFKYSNAR